MVRYVPPGPGTHWNIAETNPQVIHEGAGPGGTTRDERRVASRLMVRVRFPSAAPRLSSSALLWSSCLMHVDDRFLDISAGQPAAMIFPQARKRRPSVMKSEALRSGRSQTIPVCTARSATVTGRRRRSGQQPHRRLAPRQGSAHSARARRSQPDRSPRPAGPPRSSHSEAPPR